MRRIGASPRLRESFRKGLGEDGRRVESRVPASERAEESGSTIPVNLFEDLIRAIEGKVAGYPVCDLAGFLRQFRTVDVAPLDGF